MRSRKIHSWMFLVLATGLLCSPGLAAEEDWDAPVKKWGKGPVSYLLTEDEEKSYKKLKGEEERATFIDEFWERRNPHEMAVPNHFQGRFYGRVERVDTMLKDQGIPAGWKSDLARVLILLGQPDSFQLAAVDAGGGAQEAPQPSGPDAAGGGGGQDGGGQERAVKITMIYKDLTALGLRANLELEFLKDGLTTRLETRVDLGTDAVRGLDREVLAQEFPAGEEAPMEEFLSLEPSMAEPPSAASAADALMDPLVQSVQRELLLEVLDSGEASTAIPFESIVDVYKAKAGKTYVAISLAIEKSKHTELGGDSGVHPIAALRDQADPDNLFLYDSDDLFAPADENAAAAEGDLLRFQAGDGVNPGTYTLVTGWVNTDGDITGLKVQDLEAPDFSRPQIQISSVTLAETWEATNQPESELKRPYILGNRRVVPKVAPAFPVNGELAIYYQIYNAAPDGGSPDLQIGYHISRKRGTRFARPTVAPPLSGVTDLVQIYELALAGWPAGEYKIKVIVTDNHSGAFAEREVFFHIE